LAQCRRVSLVHLRQSGQRAGMCAQRKQIGPELIVQLARDLLALGILQRDGTFGELPFAVHGLAERRRQMVQFGTYRRQFRRAAGLDPHGVGQCEHHGASGVDRGVRRGRRRAADDNARIVAPHAISRDREICGALDQFAVKSAANWTLQRVLRTAIDGVAATAGMRFRRSRGGTEQEQSMVNLKGLSAFPITPSSRDG
ncbi:hypothetical protein SB7C_12260, partial [Staphylococcus epidermidis]